VLHLELAVEDLGVGRVADGDEAALQGDVLAGAAIDGRMRMPVTPLASPSTSSST
jgi:hypothetical protein